MSPRGRGTGKTPVWVIDLVKELLTKSRLLALSNATGIGMASLARYRDGIGEPTFTTLQRLSDYTGKTFDIQIKPQSGDIVGVL